jgi:hypothetical protein
LFTGVYESEQAHRQIPIKTIKGVKVALLSYTFGTNDHQPTHDYTVDTVPSMNMISYTLLSLI